MKRKNMKKTSCEAEDHLSSVDPILAQLIAKYGSCPLLAKQYEPYPTLVRSIISQQLSAKVADTIERRVLALARDFTPARILEIPTESLRGAGLSAAKCRYIRELSARVIDGRMQFDGLVGKSDDEAVAILTELPGVGRWTAEMFLIFGLGRPDVLASGDAGLRRAVRQLYGETAVFEKVGRKWKPYRSVASWYLWKHLDG